MRIPLSSRIEEAVLDALAVKHRLKGARQGWVKPVVVEAEYSLFAAADAAAAVESLHTGVIVPLPLYGENSPKSPVLALKRLPLYPYVLS